MLLMLFCYYNFFDSLNTIKNSIMESASIASLINEGKLYTIWLFLNIFLENLYLFNIFIGYTRF